MYSSFVWNTAGTPLTATSNPYLRVDQSVVYLDADPTPGPWARAEGGAVSIDDTGRTIEDVTLWRHHRQQDRETLLYFLKRLGKPASITLFHLDSQGLAQNGGWQYKGTLSGLRFVDYDANRSNAAMYSVTVSPTELNPI